MKDECDEVSEEKALVQRAQSGDALAFESLYRANVGRVYAVCLRMLKNPSSAEDLTQDAFVRAWTKLHTYRGASAFSTWMHRLTVNLVLSELRTQGRRKERLMTVDALARLKPAPTSGPPDLRADLRNAIADLPEGARKVFVLHEVEGYRHDEIAEILGIASGTTKAQLHRARRLLREALA